MLSIAEFKRVREHNDGKLPHWAWPGGYQIIYLTQDGETLCSECANGENGSEAHETQEDAQWKLIGQEVHWEGESLYCAHCNKELESEYGSDEED